MFWIVHSKECIGKAFQDRGGQREAGFCSGPWRCEHDIMAGVELVRKGKRTGGSLTQMGTNPTGQEDGMRASPLD